MPPSPMRRRKRYSPRPRNSGVVEAGAGRPGSSRVLSMHQVSARLPVPTPSDRRTEQCESRNWEVSVLIIYLRAGIRAIKKADLETLNFDPVRRARKTGGA